MRSRFDVHNLLAKTNRSVMRTVYSRRLPQILSRRDFCLKPILDSKIRNLPTTYRLLSTESSFKGIGDGDNGDNSIASKWIAHFNATVAAHAETSIWTFLALRVGSWYTLAYIYTYVPDIGPELAIGYLVCKFTGKLRQPANLGLAALISYQFPILSTIKASALIGLVKNSTANQLNKPTIVVKIEKFLDWMTGPIDKYGFSYFIASKVNMGVLLLGASFAVKTGLDVSYFLLHDTNFIGRKGLAIKA